jgi:hypothetical protein
VGKQEAERNKTEFVPTENDLQNIEKVLKSFEKNKVNDSEVETEQNVDENETKETTYFVDDEAVVQNETEEEKPKIKRLNYSK